MFGTRAQVSFAHQAVPFNLPSVTGNEIPYLADALRRREFGRSLAAGARRRGNSLLTHSCTAALEMAVILAGLGPGDEVYIHIDRKRGGVARFSAGVRRHTTGDVEHQFERIEAAITPRTKAIFVVHYARRLRRYERNQRDRSPP